MFWRRDIVRSNKLAKAKVERKCRIECDAGETRRAKSCNSGPSVQEEPTFLRGYEEIEMLDIALAGRHRV